MELELILEVVSKLAVKTVVKMAVSGNRVKNIKTEMKKEIAGLSLKALFFFQKEN